MPERRWACSLAVACLMLAVPAYWPSHAQVQEPDLKPAVTPKAFPDPEPPGFDPAAGPKPDTEPKTDPAVAVAIPAGSVAEALKRPYPWDFKAETSIAEVVAHLKSHLRGRVVLDIAALDRLDLRPEDRVQLDLPEGVRLRTGLKLLLDQMGMTFKVESEDDLLILTDAEGADDPIDRVSADLKAIHRELHDLQDQVAEIAGAMGITGPDPMMRKPTYIEEQPEDAPPPEELEKKSRPRPGA